MVISFNNNNIHEAISTDPYEKEVLKYIYIDRKKDLMVACNPRIIVTMPIEFDDTDKVPNDIEHLYLSKEMFLYAKKNKCPIIFQEDGIHINEVIYQYLNIGPYAPYEQFLIPDKSDEFINVFQCKMKVKDLLSVIKSNAVSDDCITITFKARKSSIKENLDEQKIGTFGIVHNAYGDNKLGLVYSFSTIYNTGEKHGEG